MELGNPDIWWLAYVALGLVAGFLAGLLGVGGGALMVPVLATAFTRQGIDYSVVLHLALGTSMATIILTAIASVRAHHARAAVMWPVVGQMAPGALFGTLAGSVIAANAPTRALAIFFSCFVLLIAAQLASNFKPAAHRTLPGPLGVAAVGGVIGLVSALVAIGGGSMTVPWLAWHNVSIHRAIGTSAGLGLPIAVFGSLGYLITGWEANGLPTGSVGYIYLPALLCLACGSVASAPLGAKLAHRLPVLTLKRIFAGLLVLLSAHMLWHVGLARAA